MPSQLKLDVASFLPGPSGFLFACGKGAWGNGGWKGFARFDDETGRHETVPCDLTGPITRFAGGLVGRSAEDSRALVKVDEKSGVELARTALDFDLEALQASPVGAWLLLEGESQLALADAKLKVRRLGEVLPKKNVNGAGFDVDGSLLVAVTDKRSSLVRVDPAKGKPKAVQDLSRHLPGLFQVRDGVVLVADGFALKLGEPEVLELGQGRCFWADETGSDLVQAPADGTLLLRTLEGKVKKKLKWRRGPAVDAFARAGTLVISNGAWLDFVALGAAKPKKK